MKKLISAILAAAIAASVLTAGGISVSATESNKNYIYGDADLDGAVTVGDCTLVQKASVGITELSDLQKQIADVDGSGDISVLDASCIQRYIAGYTQKTGKTGEEFIAQTQHRLLKSVKVYRGDKDSQEWELETTTNIEYKNAYPTVIEEISSEEEIGTVKTNFDYTFENGLPKTCTYKRDAENYTTTVEYNNGRIYNSFIKFDDGDYINTWYQYAYGDEYFTSMFRETYTVGNEYFPEQFAEETDSVQVLTENGLMKKSINSGFYANWNENEPKRWLRFNGTYTAEYDSDGIAKLMSAVFRAGPPQTSYVVEVEKENGVITGAVVNRDTSLAKKLEFEYTDTEISAARYSQMMNYFIIGSGTNYYNNNWY